MRRRTLVLSALFAALAAMPLACLSPTLPLPPPEEPENVGLSGDDGVWEVRGSCTPGAVVLVKNLATGVIAGTEDKDNDGRYLVRIEAEECDGAEVYEIVGTTTSDQTFFLIEPTVSGVSEGICR